MIKEKLRSEIKEEDKWDLTGLYKTEDEWNKDYDELQGLISKFDDFKGKLNNSKDILKYFEFNNEVNLKLENVCVYTYLKFDEDTTNTHFQELKGRADNLLSEFSLVSSFVMPELCKLSKDDIEKFMAEEEGLRKYKYDFDCILRIKNHVLSDKEESLLSNLEKPMSVSEEVSSYLRDADMKFSPIKDEDGNEVELTNTNYERFITSKDRNVRKSAFLTLYKSYEELIHTFASAYQGKVSLANRMAKIRGYKGAREAALDSNFVDNKIYDNLVATVNKHLDIMDDYYAMKREVMGLPEIHIYDIYSRLVPSYDKKYTFEEAKNIVLEALSVLGDDYVNNLKKAFDERWIDIYPNKGKTGGAYERGCYKTHPYVLLNFNGKFNDVSTIVHELGHAMHSYYSDKNNDYAHHQYEIFVAEVASQVNEILLAKYLLNKSTDRNEKLYILDNLMETFKGSIIRQTMFAEFEDLMHKEEAKGTVLTSDFLSDNYYKLYQKYSGKNMISDKEIRYEWARIPHFYYDFYVYQYSTGLASACFIANNILNKKEGFLEKYLKFLSLGGSMDPVDELREAGVDISKPEVIEEALNMFKETIEEFKNIYSEK
ncbi:MAG TPA: oligoendopeptidase F [Candidatus Coprosoma intestinipullorum]|uniref:Oligopeptidase F n=1 Tax=Candidatus Coprosoma intestinipullorum TaxID=2840752 RepID=A0A9D0ZS21_9FIRM|nr:oligoendopeptidase F [Candidatus Coprosoma intestinipullorum]